MMGEQVKARCKKVLLNRLPENWQSLSRQDLADVVSEAVAEAVEHALNEYSRQLTSAAKRFNFGSGSLPR